MDQKTRLLFRELNQGLHRQHASNDNDIDDANVPKMFRLSLTQNQKNNSNSQFEYVKQFVREVRKLHFGDRENEFARKESLGHCFTTENLFPEALRETINGDKVFIKAMIPICEESHDANFSKKRPVYTITEKKFKPQKVVFGVLTSNPVGYLPPVSIS